MSQPIRTYRDLCEERARLQNKLDAQKQRIKDDWHGLKEELNPVRNAFGLVGKMTHADKSNPLVNIGLKIASDLLLKNFVLSKAGWAARLAVPFVVKNFSSHLIAEKGAGFIHKISSLFKGRSKGWAKRGAMNDKDNKVVNTEEQNRSVNPGTGDYQEISPKEHVGTNQATTGNRQEPDKRAKPEKERNSDE
ncbi:MAG: hypothetical protein JNK79_05065 [Chitinophagaceae bacterium]|nr:hypothetical protein [Chitinophagaceae bacterium]